MKTAQHWIDRLDEVNSERDQQNWVRAIQKDARKGMSKLKSENRRMKNAIRETLTENAHLADGDVCTLIKLKLATRIAESANDALCRPAGDASGAQKELSK